MELIGYLAAFCTTTSFIPQIYKIFKTKIVEGISSPMYVMFCAGLILWIIYGIQICSNSLIIANVITLVLALPVLISKFCIEYRRKIK